MAQMIDRDSIDFAVYERQTDASVKVRRASQFHDDLVAEFAQEDGEPTCHEPTMTSTKLRNLIHFRPGEVTAWAGYNGHRKSMFVGQMVLDLCQQKQRTLVASMEMLPRKTLGRMARQAAGTRWPDLRWLAAFGQWSDNKLWLFDHMGRITPSQCIAVCRYFADELKGQHVVIDSLMMVCASEDTFDEQKQFVTDLCRVAQETGLHIHLVTHCRKPQSGEDRAPTKYDIRGTSAISDQVSNVITVWQNKPKTHALEKNPHDIKASAEPDALVSVEKQRNGEWEGKVQLWFHGPSLRFADERADRIMPFPLEAA
jgi:twinkle protein